MDGYYGGYALLGLLLLAGAAVVVIAYALSSLLRPTRVTREKLLTYECGMDPVGEGWAQTEIRYYVYAFLYVIFAIDSVFLYPWATVFADDGFGGLTLGEMFVFLGFLTVGLLYAWKKRVLQWV